jgi:hypothetical protein
MKMNRDIKKLKIKMCIVKVVSVSLCILLFAIIGLLIPLRPSYSESEKRKLAEFPEFTIQSFFSGKYLSDIGTWYSDTYPGRESLISLNTKFKEFYGFSSDLEIHGEVVQGDEIPEEFSETETQNSVPEETTRESFVIENLDTQSLGAVFVAGNVGYEYYNFSQNLANDYISVMNSFADKITTNAKVYNMIVPTSIGITLPDNYIETINSSNQEKSINYMISGFDSDVNAVPVFDALMSHRKEYIYFNTDHHWTALGAYYAYEEFCEKSGKTPYPLTQFTQVEYDGFLGSFYNDTGKISSLKNNPDTVIAYIPNKNAKMVFTDKKGNLINWPIIGNVSSYNETLKYSTFIGGDNPFTEIINPDITDNSSIVVVKESFGNAFVPFLVENYSKIYVIDYRYYNDSISKFVNENEVQDVLYLNNISATRNKWLISRLKETV